MSNVQGEADRTGLLKHSSQSLNRPNLCTLLKLSNLNFDYEDVAQLNNIVIDRIK